MIKCWYAFSMATVSWNVQRFGGERSNKMRQSEEAPGGHWSTVHTEYSLSAVGLPELHLFVTPATFSSAISTLGSFGRLLRYIIEHRNRSIPRSRYQGNGTPSRGHKASTPR